MGDDPCVGMQLTSQTRLCVGSSGPGKWADITHKGHCTFFEVVLEQCFQ